MRILLDTRRASMIPIQGQYTAQTQRECDRIIEFLSLVEKWMRQDIYRQRCAELRRTEWYGMSIG